MYGMLEVVAAAYVAFDQWYFDRESFALLHTACQTLGKKINGLIKYLNKST